jgi:hypothetical protein
MFLGYSGGISDSSGGRAGGVFFSYCHQQNHKIKVARLGHKTSDFAICEFVDRWRQKMDG